ncbi:MAG: hypothetical protein A4E51_01764 [Methanosaeta sp. PtaU1.Bin055]|nr:MAG: hypothetical protein A4E51_01764 [Methanosaeta sp. PtaU1.Bin055]
MEKSFVGRDALPARLPRVMNQPEVMWLRRVFVVAAGARASNSGKTSARRVETRASEAPRASEISWTRSSPSTVPFL